MFTSLLLTYLSGLFALASNTFITHNSEVERRTSPNNLITFDLIDDAVFDIRYETNCKECNCSINLPTLNYASQSDVTFSTNVTDSCIISNNLYLVHTSVAGEVSYSMFEITLPNVLKPIITEARLPALDGFKNVGFFSNDMVFAGYSQNTLVIYTIDQQGAVQDKKYSLNRDQSDQQQEEPSDIIYTQEMLFLARGSSGLEVLTIRDPNGSDLDRTVFSAADLEMGSSFQSTKLELDFNKHILYVYDPNSIHDCLVGLDISDKTEITLLNNYHLGSANVVQVIPTSQQLLAVTRLQDKCYLMQISGSTSDRYSGLNLNKVWEIPGHIDKVHKNDNKVLIETENALYILKKDLSYEIERSDLLIDIVDKGSKTNFFPVVQEEVTYLVAIDPLAATLASIEERQKLNLECGIYKQDYAGTVFFNVSVYRDSCPEAPEKEAGNICLDQYKYDVDFSGANLIQSTFNPLSPISILISNWTQLISNSYNDSTRENLPNTQNNSNIGTIPAESEGQPINPENNTQSSSTPESEKNATTNEEQNQNQQAENTTNLDTTNQNETTQSPTTNTTTGTDNTTSAAESSNNGTVPNLDNTTNVNINGTNPESNNQSSLTPEPEKNATTNEEQSQNQQAENTTNLDTTNQNETTQSPTTNTTTGTDNTTSASESSNNGTVPNLDNTTNVNINGTNPESNNQSSLTPEPEKNATTNEEQSQNQQAENTTNLDTTNQNETTQSPTTNTTTGTDNTTSASESSNNGTVPNLDNTTNVNINGTNPEPNDNQKNQNSNETITAGTKSNGTSEEEIPQEEEDLKKPISDDGGGGSPRPSTPQRPDGKPDWKPTEPRPELMEPTPYINSFNNIYVVIILGVLFSVFVGFLVKCILDFVKNNREDQFRHQQLPEIEESEYAPHELQEIEYSKKKSPEREDKSATEEEDINYV